MKSEVVFVAGGEDEADEDVDVVEESMMVIVPVVEGAFVLGPGKQEWSGPSDTPNRTLPPVALVESVIVA